jgi:hypothetical protein
MADMAASDVTYTIQAKPRTPLALRLIGFLWLLVMALSPIHQVGFL